MSHLTTRSLLAVALFATALLPIILLAAVLSLASPAHAAGVVGDGTPGSCTEAAFDAALVGGGEVTFNCGPPVDILLASVKTISQDTTILGGDEITLLGGTTTRLFRVESGATLVLQDIILGDAYSGASNGGAISNDGGVLILDGVTILTSKTDATHIGGAIATNGPTFISNSTLANNIAGAGGGALFAHAGANVTISNTLFIDNQVLDMATGRGGAIWAYPSTNVMITGGQMSGNTALLGGAVAIWDATVTLAGDNAPMGITNNSALQDGGAIYNFDGTLHISQVDFVGNKAPMNTIGIGYGGTIANLGTMRLEDSQISLSEGRFGGAVFVGGNVPGTRATISDTVFYQNKAGSLGGGLYTNVETTVITVTNSVFNGNSAATGGGIGRFAAQLRIRKSAIISNTASNVGGGLYVSAGPVGTEGGYVLVRDTTISSNNATSGQGGGVYNQALLDLANVTIKNNSNGIFNFGMTEATRIHNSALHNPGSLNCDGDGTPTQSDGGNFSGDMSCAFAGPGDQQGAGLDPELGPLTGDPYGITYYHMPQPGSPLINAAVLSCSLTDQRGALRPDACDIGAVEFGGEIPVEGLAASNDSPTPLGQPTTLTATVTSGSSVSYQWALGDGQTGSGAVVTHTYPTAGVYTAVVTATNSVSTITATTVVTIEAEILYLPVILKP